MLALPERIAEPRPRQVLTLEELEALTRWKLTYEAEARMVNAGMDADDARRAGRRLQFFWWAYRAGVIGADDRAPAED